MKMTKLLTGAAIAALVAAGGASAQNTLSVVNLGTNVNNAIANGNASATYYIASELNVQNAARTTQLGFTVSNPTNWTTGAAKIRVDFTGFLLNQAAVAGDVTTGGGCAVTSVEGGTAGDKFVVFNIDNIALCSGNSVAISGLDLLYTGPSSANYTVTVTNTATGNNLGAPVSHAGAAISGSSATRGLVASRSIIDVGRSGSAGVFRANSPGFQTLTTTTATAVDARENPALTYVDFARGNSGGQTIDYTMTVPNADGLNLSGFRIGTTAPSVNGNVLEFENISGASQAVTISAATGNDAAAIREQTLTGTVSVDFTSSLMKDFTANVTYGSIVRQGERSGLFEWVGDADASNESVFRMTGFKANAPLPVIRATFQNETKDLAESEIVLNTSTAGFSFSNGELVFSSRELGRQAGDYDRADVTFFFEGSSSPRIRRFISANGNLEAFPGDFDQTCSATKGTVTNGAITINNGNYTVNGGSLAGVSAVINQNTGAQGSGGAERGDVVVEGARNILNAGLTQADSTATQAESELSLNAFSCSQ